MLSGGAGFDRIDRLVEPEDLVPCNNLIFLKKSCHGGKCDSCVYEGLEGCDGQDGWFWHENQGAHGETMACLMTNMSAVNLLHVPNLFACVLAM